LQVVSDKEKSEIITFTLVNQIFFCGHASGTISAWVPIPTAFLQCAGMCKIHDGAINRIAVKIVIDPPAQYLLTCSSDSTLKVYVPDENFTLRFTRNFDSVLHKLNNKFRLFTIFTQRLILSWRNVLR
jgi:hypothetical protein